MTDIIENLRHAIRAPREEERLRAVDELFQSRDLRAVPLLRQVAESDPSLHVRYMAQRSIYLLASELGSVLEDEDPLAGIDSATDGDPPAQSAAGKSFAPPSAAQPAAAQPAAAQPAAVQPAAVQPAAVQPAAVQPAAVQPVAVQPAAVLPAGARPVAPTPARSPSAPATPAAAAPAVAAPAVAAPAVAAPAVAAPSAAAPAAAAPHFNLAKYQTAYSSAPPQQRAKLIKVAVHYKASSAVPFLCSQADAEQSPQLQALLLVAVGMLGGPDQVPFLARYVESPSAGVRFAVVDALEHIAHPSAFPLIARFLSDDDSQIRLRVVAALKRLGKNGLQQLFIHMLDSGKLWMRDTAAYALSVLTSVDFLPILQKGMRDPEREVRRKIRTGLERLVEKGCAEARELLKSFSDQTMAFEDDAAELFAGIEIGAGEGPDPLFDDVGARRLTEVDRIIEERDTGRLTALCAAVQGERDPEIRAQMVKAVGVVGSEDAIKYLVKRLTDNSPTVRTNAVEAIAALCPNHIPEDVELLLYDEDPMVRASSVVALKDAYPKPALRTLQDMASHRDAAFREAAFFAVSAVADQRVIPIVVPLATDEDDTIRGRALQLIDQFTSEGHAIAAAIVAELPDDVRAQLGRSEPPSADETGFLDDEGFESGEQFEDFAAVKIPDFDV